jgi:hypothetical protein
MDCCCSGCTRQALQEPCSSSPKLVLVPTQRWSFRTVCSAASCQCYSVKMASGYCCSFSSCNCSSSHDSDNSTAVVLSPAFVTDCTTHVRSLGEGWNAFVKPHKCQVHRQQQSHGLPTGQASWRVQSACTVTRQYMHQLQTAAAVTTWGLLSS